MFVANIVGNTCSRQMCPKSWRSFRITLFNYGRRSAVIKNCCSTARVHWYVTTFLYGIWRTEFPLKYEKTINKRIESTVHLHNLTFFPVQEKMYELFGSLTFLVELRCYRFFFFFCGMTPALKKRTTYTLDPTCLKLNIILEASIHKSQYRISVDIEDIG